MNINAIEESLNYINEQYSEIILTSNYIKKNNAVTWQNYKKGIYNRILYSKEYEMLLNERQYSFLLKDKSFFQFFYEFENNELIKAKLCYYPYPLSNKESDIELLMYLEESGSELLDIYYYGFNELLHHGIKSTNTSHIRFDYDKDVNSHSKSHIQYSGVNNVRFPLIHVFIPITFFDFIICHTEFSRESLLKREKEGYIRTLRQAEKIMLPMIEEKGIHITYNPL
ncbi:DUF2290 domain-containing protein [Kosakonia cowanii]|jgi:hypothetical protein|uniref:DUF2290 domain-containing protein n=1 Tax=Kosakonia cowanii TaxID=208223 RepID=UPI001F59AE96|nr:DUF2290 domain-containing protein [Kosakonia cowanii]